MDQVTNYLTGQWWIMQVFIVVFTVLTVNFVQRRLLNKVQKRLKLTATVWDDALVDAASRPLTLLVWIIGLTFAAEIVAARTDAAIYKAIDPIRDVGVITSLTWFLLRMSRCVEKNIITTMFRRIERLLMLLASWCVCLLLSQPPS